MASGSGNAGLGAGGGVPAAEATIRAGCLGRLPQRFANAAENAGVRSFMLQGVQQQTGAGFGAGAAAQPLATGGEGGAVDLDGFEDTIDGRAFVASIEREVVTEEQDGGVDLERDVVGLDEAKRLLHEAIVLPLVVPDLFQGMMGASVMQQPWKGVLLFGPPGNGKTMLAKAVANMHGICFINCSASLLMNKYLGDSEKMVRAVFTVARARAPSILFFDEVDSVMSERGGKQDSESTRRFKSEMLSQMDGIYASAGTGESPPSVIVVAASNFPWDLDQAFRRRLEKRVYIPLPGEGTRFAMFQKHLSGVLTAPGIDYAGAARATAGFSSADIRSVCREAAMHPIRRLLDRLNPVQIQQFMDAGVLDVPAVTNNDILEALANTNSSISTQSIRRFKEWDAKFGTHLYDEGGRSPPKPAEPRVGAGAGAGAGTGAGMAAVAGGGVESSMDAMPAPQQDNSYNQFAAAPVAPVDSSSLLQQESDVTRQFTELLGDEWERHRQEVNEASANGTYLASDESMHYLNQAPPPDVHDPPVQPPLPPSLSETFPEPAAGDDSLGMVAASSPAVSAVSAYGLGTVSSIPEALGPATAEVSTDDSLSPPQPVVGIDPVELQLEPEPQPQSTKPRGTARNGPSRAPPPPPGATPS